MDFIGALTILGTILGIVAVVGAAAGFALRGNLRGQAGQDGKGAGGQGRGITVLLLSATLLAQYLFAPASSIFTFLPGVPFPRSTLRDCHITRADLPAGPVTHSVPAPRSDIEGQVLNISGSSVLYKLFLDAGDTFDGQESTVTTVQKLNSEQGLQDVLAGRSQIGLSDIFAEDDPNPTVSEGARDLLDYQVAVAPFTLLVSGDLQENVQNLTTQQVIAIYSGTVTNWHSLGGPDEPITVFNRPLGSGTRVIFEKYVLGFPVPSDDLRARTTQGLVALLTKTRGAIGYAATSSVVHDIRDAIFPICIDGYGATTANINSGTYPFWSYEHAYVSEKARSDVALAFLRFICGADFQTKDVTAEGFLQLSQLSTLARTLHADDYPPSQPCA